MKKEKRPTMKLGTQKGTSHSNSLEAQRERLLNSLRKGPITTTCARDTLDILAPAPRVHELRHNFGHNIKTYWKTITTSFKQKHRVAEYVLLPGKWDGKIS